MHEDPGLAEFDALIRTIPIHARMGLKLLQRGPEAKLTMELTEEVRGGGEGSVHGGILATFADVTCANTLWGAYGDDEGPVTTDMHVRYYRQPHRGPLTGEGRLVHRGRRILSAECSVMDADQRVLARATATYMIVPRRF